MLPFSAPPARAAPTLEEVSRSYQDKVDGDVGSERFLPYLAGAIGLVILLAVVSQRRKTAAAAPKALNHQGKLMREVLRSLPLKKREVKQLRALAERAETERPLTSPLTLLLCPSVLARTIQATKPRTDRKVVLSVARKAGLQVTRK